MLCAPIVAAMFAIAFLLLMACCPGQRASMRCVDSHTFGFDLLCTCHSLHFWVPVGQPVTAVSHCGLEMLDLASAWWCFAMHIVGQTCMLLLWMLLLGYLSTCVCTYGLWHINGACCCLGIYLCVYGLWHINGCQGSSAWH